MLAEYHVGGMGTLTSNVTSEITYRSHTDQRFIMHYVVGLLNYPTALNLAINKTKVWVS